MGENTNFPELIQQASLDRYLSGTAVPMPFTRLWGLQKCGVPNGSKRFPGQESAIGREKKSVSLS